MQRCVCASNSPGRTVDLERSMTCASAGICTFAPTASIFRPRTRMIWFAAVVPFSVAAGSLKKKTMTLGGPGGGYCASVFGAVTASKTIDSVRRQTKMTRARMHDSLNDREGMLPEIAISGKRQVIRAVGEFGFE